VVKGKIIKAALALVKDNKVLMSKNFNVDKYYIPGGTIEENETDIEALIREVKEELSVDVVEETIKFIGIYEDVATNQPDKIVQIRLYSADILGELKPDNEVEKLGWFGKDDDWEILGTVAKTKIMPALVDMGMVM
jgi:8-oxo-dGTP pyrophosphatase MutT (NUDIX family)